MRFDVFRDHFASKARIRSLMHAALAWGLPLGIAAAVPGIAPAQECLYVLNQLGNSVTMIDRSTNRRVNTLEMPNDDCPPPGPCTPMPTALEFSPATGRAYVTRQDVNLVYVLDPVALTVVDTVTIDSGSSPGAASSAAALSPNGARLYVTNLAIDTVSVIDTGSNAVVDTIDVRPPAPLRARPRAVTVTPDGSTVLVGNSSNDSLSVIRASDGAVTDTLAVGDGPAGIAVPPNGERAFITNGSSASVWSLDLGDLVVDDMIAVGQGPRGIAITPNGALAFVTNLLAMPGTVSVIDAVSGNISGDPITVGGGPVAVAISDDGSTAYVANLMANSISVIDTGSRSVEDIGSVSTPFDLAFGPCPPSAVTCTGDCDDNGTVNINELISGVNITLGNRPLEICMAFDNDQSGTVTISELIQAVNNVLDGCPS
jgi:YVTN family beta-propeller protein